MTKSPPGKLTLTQSTGKKVIYQVKPEVKPVSVLAKPNATAPLKIPRKPQSKVEPVQPQSKPTLVSQPKPAAKVDYQALAEQKRQKAQALLAWLVEQYPNCFNPQAKKPLKVGIHKELRALHPEVKHSDLARALEAYTLTTAYYEGVLQESQRYGLDGQPSGEITSTEKEHAQGKLAKLAEKAQPASQAADSINHYRLKAIV